MCVCVTMTATMLKSLKKADVEMVSYRKTLFNKNRMPNTESHIYNNFQMGIFSRSSDRNGQFSVMFMLLHFLVYFSKFHFIQSLYRSVSLTSSLLLPFIVWTCRCMAYFIARTRIHATRTTLLLSLHLHSSVAFFLSLTGPVWAVAKARASSCFIHIILWKCQTI